MTLDDRAAAGGSSAVAADPILQGGSVALSAALGQLAALLEALTDLQYADASPAAFSSSVGNHVRHCLDHVEALLVGAESGVIDYDARERGTVIETDRSAALAAVRRYQRQLHTLPPAAADMPIRLTTLLDPAAPPALVASTLGREFAFVLSHTIHHSALIGALTRTLGVEPPRYFGYAPATIAHLAQPPCAR